MKTAPHLPGERSKSGNPVAIQYFVLSDLHLGATGSLLTDADETGRRRASAVLQQLALCLRTLALRHSSPRNRPALILNGDILELALSRLEDALAVFRTFVEALFPRGEPDAFARTIIYLPGNHDHHVWELAREEEFTRNLQYRARPARSARSQRSPRSFHTLPALAATGLASSLLEAALPPRLRPGPGLKIEIRYPNLALGSPENRVVLHHGHFTEKIYYQISYLRDLIFPGRRPARTVEDIEAENFAWIDFLWSTLGRSGNAGRDLELLYEKAQDEAEIERVIYRFATNVTAKHHPPSMLDRLKAFFVYLLIRTAERALVGTEVRRTRTPLSRSSWKVLQRYVSGPLRAELDPADAGAIPLTFLFGHTHKPFAETRNLRGAFSPARIINTGGWVIETPTAMPAVGADILVLDSSLRVSAIPVFRDLEDGRATVPSPGRRDSLGVEGDPDWQRLRSLIQTGIVERRARLVERIQSEGSLVARLQLWARRRHWRRRRHQKRREEREEWKSTSPKN